MTPFAALLDLPCRLRHPALRDLAWALVSPPLLADDGHQRHPLAASEWAMRPQRLADWLFGLERAPAPLEAWLGGGRPRLGHYYERLWAFALTRAPGIRWRDANLAIRAEGHTLGELDVLFEDDEGLHHLELAVKFYLGVPGARPGEAWIGPDRRDRLDLKRARLLTHQLPLSARPDTLALLARRGLGAPRAHYWMGGYLFHPVGSSLSVPPEVNATHLRGRWVRHADWPALRAATLEAPGRWVELIRLAWLSPARTDSVPDEGLGDRFVATALLDAPPERPKLLARLVPTGRDEWREAERLFLVGDDWPGLPEPNAGPSG